MRTMTKTMFSVLSLMTASTAMADDDIGTPGKLAAPNDGTLPAPQSDHDVQPEVATPAAQLPPGGVVEQAGVGGVVGYGRAGVLELGGAAGLQMSSEFRSSA